MDMLGRLLDILGEKSAMFARGKQGDKRSWVEFSTATSRISGCCTP